MNTVEYFKEHFDQLQPYHNELNAIRSNAFHAFNKLGVPTTRNEEWKYTRMNGLFNKEFKFPATEKLSLSSSDIDFLRLPLNEKANELIFVNGIFSFELSSVYSPGLTVLPLEQAAGNEFKNIVLYHFGSSGKYLKDGINALNTAFVHGAVFIHVKKGAILNDAVHIYNIADSRNSNIFCQPRSLVYIDEGATIQFTETFNTIGIQDSFTNQVMEIVVEKNAMMELYKIQNDAANIVSTTHIHQVAKSYVQTVTISLNGGIVRNNLNVIMDAAYCEAHLYGLYFQQGQSHIDNHTLVDNKKPNCLSNEFYKGILNDHATGVFNGKIYVQPQAQKTNAYQSNKNILLSNNASVNSKPQLEIFADDVKCSHGCTVGQLDEEGLFYLRSRGIPEKIATSLLLYGFAADILEKIRSADVRSYVDELISKRLQYDIS